MKAFFTLLFSILISVSSLQAQAPQGKLTIEKPRSDRNVELLSLVFRLADASEYAQKSFELYTYLLEEYFGKYRDHELIRYAKQIRAENGIGYDAVASMSIYLDENLQMKEGVITSNLDRRWNEENIKQFITLLNQFRIDTDFDKFYNDNTDLYEKSLQWIIPFYEELDIQWFSDFFGSEPKEKFIILVAMGNAGNMYGPSLEYNNGAKEVYSIMSPPHSFDEEGIPSWPDPNNKMILEIMIHEFNHSFVNHINETHIDILEESGKKIFDIDMVKFIMARQAYSNWKTMINEALVRASVIQYMKNHNFSQDDIEQSIQEQKSLGFFWIESLLKELDRYQEQRDVYPTLESFIPEIAKFYNSYADKLYQIINSN